MAAPGILIGLEATLRIRGVDAYYRRGDSEIGPVAFIRGKADRLHTPEQGGVRTVVRRDDWICRAEDLFLDGVQITPQVDDLLLLRLHDDQVQTYAVTPIEAEPCWRFLPDTDDLWLRIHTHLSAQG